MQNEAIMNESKYSEQFYAQGEDGKDYQIEIELEDGPSAEDPEKITVVLNGERKTVDVPKGGTDDHYKKAIAAGLKELGKYKLVEGKLPSTNEGKYPEFVKIESEDDYKNYVVPALGDILKKGYEFNDIKGLWFELGEDSEGAVPKGRRKTMRQILRLEGPGARFLESYSDRINNPLASEYVQGMDAEWYGVKEDDLYEGKTSSKGQPMKITVKETKCGEALSPKMQQRLKIKAWQAATDKMKGFQEAGHGFLDMFNGDKMSSIILPAEGKATKEEGEAVAKKLLGDFDDYLDIGTDLVEEGGPNGEDVYLPYYGLKKEFFDLPQEEGITILSELSDVLYKELTGDKKGKHRESNEEISPKLQDRLKFKEFAQFFNELPFFGQTIGDPLDTIRKVGLLYGVGNGSKKEQEEAAKDILSDFDDYTSWTTDQDTDGKWYIKVTFKPELWALPIEELKKVFGLLDDAFGPWS